MNTTTTRIAQAINSLYAANANDPSVIESIDAARDEIANALGLDGQCSSFAFVTMANTKPAHLV
jgi:hypothetical protein